MNPFANLVLRINSADNGTLLQQIFAMFAKINTMTEQEVIVAWQALGMVRTLTQDPGCRKATETLRLALKGRIKTICLEEESSWQRALGASTAQQRFRAALGDYEIYM